MVSVQGIIRIVDSPQQSEMVVIHQSALSVQKLDEYKKMLFQTTKELLHVVWSVTSSCHGDGTAGEQYFPAEDPWRRSNGLLQRRSTNRDSL